MPRLTTLFNVQWAMEDKLEEESFGFKYFQVAGEAWRRNDLADFTFARFEDYHLIF